MVAVGDTPSAGVWPGDLQQRRDLGQEALHACQLCPRDCGVDRHLSRDGAWCKLGADAYAYKELLSFGEESCIGPTWLIDLSGCSLRCLFCTEWVHITHPHTQPAVPLRASWFLRRLAIHRAHGARSITFVGGEPTVNLAGVLDVLAQVPRAQQLPLVWNTNGLIGAQAWPLLHGLIHTWVVDLKLHTNAAADQLLGAGGLNYADQVRATLDAVHPARPPREQDTTPPQLLIRHLLMPGAWVEETLPTLTEIADRWPNAVVNLMTMYLPHGPALNPLKAAPALGRLVAENDRRQAIKRALQLGLRLLIDGQPPAVAPHLPT